MRIRLDIGKVIILLYESYKDAVKNPMVIKPVSYALYEVWQYADSIERPRRKKKEQDNECKHNEDGECFSKLDCVYKQADLNPDGTVNIYKCGKEQKE